MNLDQYLKGTILWNISAFQYLCKYAVQMGLPNTMFRDISAVGYNKNAILLKNISEISFVPGDEEAEQHEANASFAGISDGPMSPIDKQVNGPNKLLPSPKDPEKEREVRDIELLEKIFALEYDEKEPRNEPNGDSKELGNTTEIVAENIPEPGPVTPFEPIAPDWYGQVFKPRFPKTGGEDGQQS